MDGKARLKALSRMWHGVVLLQSAYVFMSVGLFSSMTTLVVGTGVVYVIGRLLLGGSGLTRVVLLALSTLGVIGSGFAAANGAWTFVHEWSFGLILTIALAVVSFGLYLRSLRVLTNKDVRAYIART